MKLSNKSYIWAVFLTKTTVLTSILTSEVTDMVPQPQFELGKVLGTQSGTWGNLVPHMCKSHQTTSVKKIVEHYSILCRGIKIIVRTREVGEGRGGQ